MTETNGHVQKFIEYEPESERQRLVEELLRYFEGLRVLGYYQNYRIGCNSPHFEERLSKRGKESLKDFISKKLPLIIQRLEDTGMRPGKYAFVFKDITVIVNFRPYQLPDGKHDLFLVTVLDTGMKPKPNTIRQLIEWLTEYCIVQDPDGEVKEGYLNCLKDPDFGEDIYTEGHQDAYGVAFFIEYVDKEGGNE